MSFLSYLKPPVVFIVLDHIHEVASQRFQEVGRVHLCLDLQFGTQSGRGRGEKRGRKEERGGYMGRVRIEQEGRRQRERKQGNKRMEEEGENGG